MSGGNGSASDQQFYIRSRGRVLGPFTVGRLKTLRARGQFTRVHEVSADRKQWEPASTIEHLIYPDRAEPAVEEQPAQARIGAGQESTRSGPPAQANWYYCVGGEQHGPVTLMDLRALGSQGQLRSGDLVWKDGYGDWTPVEAVPELQLQSSFPNKSLNAGRQAPIPGQAFCHACGSGVDLRAEICPQCGVRQHRADGRNRTTAAILALLLGGLGAHHFYLGHIFLGVIYLLFVWTFIPAIVALIEGIIYLTMSDEAFAAKYGSDR